MSGSIAPFKTVVWGMKFDCQKDLPNMEKMKNICRLIRQCTDIPFVFFASSILLLKLNRLPVPTYLMVLGYGLGSITLVSYVAQKAFSHIAKKLCLDWDKYEVLKRGYEQGTLRGSL